MFSIEGVNSPFEKLFFSPVEKVDVNSMFFTQLAQCNTIFQVFPEDDHFLLRCDLFPLVHGVSFGFYLNLIAKKSVSN
jgi:hypothetical protein